MTALPEISGPVNGALTEAGITTLEQVADHTEAELLALHGVGPKGIRLLRQALTEAGLQFRSGPVQC
jgi:predicted flap endonuclease-1-like 5' DNA nuclease